MLKTLAVIISSILIGGYFLFTGYYSFLSNNPKAIVNNQVQETGGVEITDPSKKIPEKPQPGWKILNNTNFYKVTYPGNWLPSGLGGSVITSSSSQGEAITDPKLVPETATMSASWSNIMNKEEKTLMSVVPTDGKPSGAVNITTIPLTVRGKKINVETYEDYFKWPTDDTDMKRRIFVIPTSQGNQFDFSFNAPRANYEQVWKMYFQKMLESLDVE